MAFYNVQLIEYPTGYQLRCYMRPIQACRKVRTSELYHDSEINEKVLESSREYKKKRSALVSQNRTVNKIYELARSNVWSYFVTLTVDPKKYDNTIDNYDLFTKGVRKYFNNLKFLYAPDLKYLIVPELHKDGKKLHFHALLSDVGGIKFVFSGKVSVGKYIYDVSECSWGKKIYNPVFDSLLDKKIATMPLNSRTVAIFGLVLECSNLSAFAIFLNFFHLSFGNELIISVKTTYIVKSVCKFGASVKGHKALIFNAGKIHFF